MLKYIPFCWFVPLARFVKIFMLLAFSKDWRIRLFRAPATENMEVKLKMHILSLHKEASRLREAHQEARNELGITKTSITSLKPHAHFPPSSVLQAHPCVFSTINITIPILVVKTYYYSDRTGESPQRSRQARTANDSRRPSTSSTSAVHLSLREQYSSSPPLHLLVD